MEFGDLLKQAQSLQDKMGDMQESLTALEVQGESGAGAVKVTLNGQGEVISVKIDPKLLNPAEGDVLEDLIVAAFQDARARVLRATQEQMGNLMGGLGLPPGFKMPF